MNSIVTPLAGDVVDGAEFFAPMASDLVDSLIGRYKIMRGKIERMAAVVNGEEYAGALDHFARGNKIEGRHISVDRMFDLPGAIASLNASAWGDALALTDVYDCMPQKRRDEWSESIREMKAPDFDEDTVRTTLGDLLASRARFFAERVDGIFQALSGTHVTNSPFAFGQRMIIAGVTSEYSYTSSSRCGTINDLRAVIAKFMGRGEPHWNSSTAVVNAARRNSGQWMPLDGGALRIRCYKIGTAHLEIHPDMAWRLNAVLASLHPRAIPHEHRTKPAKKHKEFVMMGRPLPFAVLGILSELRRDTRTNNFSLPYGDLDKHVEAEAVRVLEAIGGVRERNTILFDYDPRHALDEIITSGCIPDQKSHQFYPTPEAVALAAIDLAQIGPGDSCLEPSAGTGGLAQYMPQANTLCIEISPLHCMVLEAKSLLVQQMDFLKFSGQSFDRIVMNPPYSEGRWKAHIEHAAALLKKSGRLVAILPTTAKGKDLLPGFDLEWSRGYDNEFAGASISVVIMTAVRS